MEVKIRMSLAKLYVLRIIQIEIYTSILQEGIILTSDFKLRHNLIKLQQDLINERKQIRKFLNMIELWRLKCIT